MREAKFRAWDKERNQFRYFGNHDFIDEYKSLSFQLIDSKSGEEISEDIYNLQSWIDEKPAPIYQFTGLKDKNGVDIYEGDIIKHKVIRLKGGVGKTKILWEDVWEEEIIEDLPEFFEMKGYAEGELGQCYGADHIEVIGNIYQNKELLK